MPKLCKLTFETAIMERYRRRERSVNTTVSGFEDWSNLIITQRFCDETLKGDLFNTSHFIDRFDLPGGF